MRTRFQGMSQISTLGPIPARVPNHLDGTAPYRPNRFRLLWRSTHGFRAQMSTTHSLRTQMYRMELQAPQMRQIRPLEICQ